MRVQGFGPDPGGAAVAEGVRGAAGAVRGQRSREGMRGLVDLSNDVGFVMAQVRGDHVKAFAESYCTAAVDVLADRIANPRTRGVPTGSRHG
jgi:hypothetical protein